MDAISEYNREFLRPYGGDSATPVHVIHCGIELDRYLYRPRSAPSTGPIEVLCVASLQEHKGQRALDAIASEESPAGRIRLTLVGDGPSAPGSRGKPASSASRSGSPSRGLNRKTK